MRNLEKQLKSRKIQLTPLENVRNPVKSSKELLQTHYNQFKPSKNP